MVYIVCIYGTYISIYPFILVCTCTFRYIHVHISIHSGIYMYISVHSGEYMLTFWYTLQMTTRMRTWTERGKLYLTRLSGYSHTESNSRRVPTRAAPSGTQKRFIPSCTGLEILRRSDGAGTSPARYVFVCIIQFMHCAILVHISA